MLKYNPAVMPRHDLYCRQCDTVSEVTIPFGKALPPCPECGSNNVEKKLSIPGVIFKGKGFYKTDSCSTGSKEKEKSKNQASEKGEKDTPKKEGNDKNKGKDAQNPQKRCCRGGYSCKD